MANAAELTVYLLRQALYVVSTVVAWHYFFPGLAAVLLFILFGSSYRSYRRWQAGWLSKRIDKQIADATRAHRQMRGMAILKSIKSFQLITVLTLCKYRTFGLTARFERYMRTGLLGDLRSFYFPTPLSFALAAACFVALFYISNHPSISSLPLDLSKWTERIDSDAGGQNSSLVVTVFAGLVAVVFALIVFVAESVRDAKNFEQRRVLLRISWLWMLALTSVLTLISYLWINITRLSFLLTALVGLVTISSFGRVIRVLLDPEVLASNRLRLLKERTRSVILASARERIGNGILMSHLGDDKDIKLQYVFSKSWLNNREQRYIYVESTKSGWISDINLLELRRLSDRLAERAKRLNFSLYPIKGPSLTAGSEEQAINASRVEPQQVRPVHLLKRFGELLPPDSIFSQDSKVILALPEEFSKDQPIIDHVRIAIPHIFRFETKEPASALFRREMQGTKDQLVAAIRSVSLSSAEELRREYLEIAETFLEVLHEFGGGYSAKQADQERGNFFEQWTEIRWLRQDVRELMAVASQSDNTDVIRDIIFLPIAIATRAVSATDHLLFREFIDFTIYIYHLAREKSEGSAKKLMIERSWRHLKEVCDFFIEPRLRDRDKSATEQYVLEFQDFALYSLKTFQSLLWATYTKDNQSASRDPKTFLVLLEVLDRVYENFLSHPEYPNAASMEYHLGLATTEEERERIRARLPIQKAIEIARRQILLGKDLVRFGLASRIYELYRQHGRSEPQIGEFHEAIRATLPNNLPRLVEVFGASRERATAEYWSWDDWEMVYDGQPRWVDTHGKLDRLFCTLALQLLTTLDENAITNIKLPHSQALAAAADGPTSVKQILENIQQHPEEWALTLSDAQIARVNDLLTLLTRIKTTQDAEDAEHVRRSELDVEKLEEFKKHIYETFRQSGRLRAVAERLKIISDCTREVPPKGLLAWGFNQLDDKAAFIRDYQIAYVGWGENYGQGMADHEDELAFTEMTSSLVQKTVSETNIVRQLEDVLRTKTGTRTIILQSLDFDLEHKLFDDNRSFKREFRKDCPDTFLKGLSGHSGVYEIDGRSVPVFEVYLQKKEQKNKLAVLDLERLGQWEQYAAVEDTRGGTLIGPLFVRVTDLNADEERRNKLIASEPPWLQEYADKEGYLRARVVVEVYERFRFRIDDASQGICLTVTESNKQ